MVRPAAAPVMREAIVGPTVAMPTVEVVVRVALGARFRSPPVKVGAPSSMVMVPAFCAPMSVTV